MKSIWLSRSVVGTAVRLVAMGALAVGLGAGAHAQVQQRGVVLKSGLHSFFEGHIVRLTATQLGPLAASAQVRIDFRDATDRIVARTEGVLQRGSPVMLDWVVRRGERPTQVRATVSITTATGDPSTAAVVLEDIDPLGLTIGTRVVCSEGPPAGRDSPQTLPNCTGWTATALTIF